MSLGLGRGMFDSDIITCQTPQGREARSLELHDTTSQAQTMPSIDSAVPWLDTQLAAGGAGLGLVLERPMSERTEVSSQLNASTIFGPDG